MCYKCWSQMPEVPLLRDRVCALIRKRSQELSLLDVHLKRGQMQYVAMEKIYFATRMNVTNQEDDFRDAFEALERALIRARAARVRYAKRIKTLEEWLEGQIDLAELGYPY